MKKVLFVAHVQSHIMNFHIPYIKYFQKMGYEVWVATKMDLEKYQNINCILPNVKWVDIDFRRNPLAIKNIKNLYELMNLMNKNRFNLINTHTPVGGILARVAAKITKAQPILYTAHGFHFYKGTSLINWIIFYTVEKIASIWTDGLITINEEDYNLAFKKFKAKKTYIVDGVGVDLNKYMPSNYIDETVKIKLKREVGISEGDFVITVVAEFIKRKNHMQVIEAMRELVKLDNRFKLLLVGDGELGEYLSGKIQEYALEENIKVLGFRNDINEVLSITDLVGLFSYHEGLPKILLEAIACEKAIICTNVRGNRDLVKEGENGVLVDVNNISMTVEKILIVQKDKNIIKRFQHNNKVLKEKYSLEKIEKDMVSIYKEFLHVSEGQV